MAVKTERERIPSNCNQRLLYAVNADQVWSDDHVHHNGDKCDHEEAHAGGVYQPGAHCEVDLGQTDRQTHDTRNASITPQCYAAL